VHPAAIAPGRAGDGAERGQAMQVACRHDGWVAGFQLAVYVPRVLCVSERGAGWAGVAASSGMAVTPWQHAGRVLRVALDQHFAWWPDARQT
jgi:hypothetical protein